MQSKQFRQRYKDPKNKRNIGKLKIQPNPQDAIIVSPWRMLLLFGVKK